MICLFIEQKNQTIATLSSTLYLFNGTNQGRIIPII